MSSRFGLRLAAVAAGVVLAIAGLFPLNNNDGYGHLAQGRNIVELGHVPDRDPFSFWKPEPAPWHNYEWGYDLLSWKVYDGLGPNALLAAKCLLLFLVGFVLVRTATSIFKGGASEWAAVTVLVLAVPAVRFRLTERPHTLGILFAAVLLWGLSRLLLSESKRPWLLVGALAVMHVVWVNSHGSHLLGLVLTVIHVVVAWGAREPFKHVTVLVVLQGVASGISPFGYEILTDAIEHLVRPEYRVVVTEWAAWGDNHPVWYPVALCIHSVLLLCGARALLRGNRAARAQLLCAVMMAIMAVRSLRFLAEYMLLSAPAVAAGLAPTAERWSRAVRVALSVVAAAVALIVSPFLPPDVKFGVGESTFGLPAVAGGVLAKRVPDARIFAALLESWYLMFKVPRAKFLVDGRVPFYGAAHVQKLDEALADPALLRAVVDGYRVDTLVLEFTAPHAQAAVHAAMGWSDFRLVSLEDRHAAFVRLSKWGAGAPTFQVLTPEYTATRIVDPAIPAAVIWQDLRAMGLQENGSGYRSWIKGLLALRPLLRAGALAGARAPANDAEKVQATVALGWLRRASERLPNLQMVEVYRAMAAISACELDEAQESLERARSETGGERRETLLLGSELDLRRGNTQAVREFLDLAQAQPGVASDPALAQWLAAIRADLAAHVRCP